MIPITVVFWLIFVTAMCSIALGLMAGHAIGYRKAEKLWKTRYTTLKLKINSAYGKQKLR